MLLQRLTFGYGDVQELNYDPTTQADWVIDSLPEIYEKLHLQQSVAD